LKTTDQLLHFYSVFDSIKPAPRATFRVTEGATCDKLDSVAHYWDATDPMTTLELPETGFLRLSQVLKFIPLGKTSWWKGVKSGRFPKPVKLSERCTAWRVEDIRDLIEKLPHTP